jgi:hypothetical protein
MDELIAYYPWLAPQVAGPNAPRPRREPRRGPAGAPAAAGAAPPHAAPGAGEARSGRRRAAPRSGDSLLPLLFAA